MNTIRNQYWAWYSPTEHHIQGVYCLCAELIFWRETIREREKTSHRNMYAREKSELHPIEMCMGNSIYVFYVVVIFMFGLKSASSHSLCNNYIFRIYTVKSMWTIVWISLFHLPRHTHTNTYMSIFHRDTPCDVQLLCWNHDSVPCWVSVCFVCFELDWTKWNCFHFIELQSFE